MFSWFAAENAPVPVVGTFHTYSASRLANGIAAHLGGAGRLYGKLSARIAVSEAARWTAQRFYGGRYRIVPNGVDLGAARPDPGRPHPELRLLFVGRAEERKGLPVLLRAFEALRSAGVEARLTVAGATREEVEPLLLEPDGVEVAGRVSDEEKWALLGGADVLCAPSLGGESFGMVLTEAFASGTPVVASDIAGYRDVVRDGRDGLLVPVGDPVELGEALRGLALDPARRGAMAEAAVERARRFAWPRVAGEVLEVYEEALAHPLPEGRAARLARRAGVTLAEPGERTPPVRLPSLEPKLPPQRAPPGGPGGTQGPRRGRPAGRCRAHGPGPPAHRHRVHRACAACGDPVVGAGGLHSHVRLDAPACRGLARDPAGRAARGPAPPPRHRAGHDDRRADVGHAAGAAGRALARPDPVPAARTHARPLSRRAGHTGLPDRAQHPRPRGVGRRDVRHRGAVPGQRGRPGAGHDRARGGAGPGAVRALDPPAREPHPVTARPRGRRAGPAGDAAGPLRASTYSAARGSVAGRR